MGMHSTAIRKKCMKCEYHVLRRIEDSEFRVDWCKLAALECSAIKTCDKQGMVWVKK